MANQVQPNPINTRNVMHNTKSLNFSRTSLSVLSGVVSGILGLTSVYGFLFYLITSGLLGMYYLLSESRSDATHFLNKQQLVTAFVAENLFTYILVWTLIYGCVHVYWEMHRLMSLCQKKPKVFFFLSTRKTSGCCCYFFRANCLNTSSIFLVIQGVLHWNVRF